MKRLVSLTLIFVTVCAFIAPMVTKASSIPQEVYVRYDLSNFTPHDSYQTMTRAQLHVFPDYYSEAPRKRSDDDPPVYAVVVVDDTMKSYYQTILWPMSVTWKMVEEWAYSILEAGDNPFENSFSINFHIVKYERWIIGGVGLLDELQMAQTTFNWPDAYPDYYDCMVIMSGNIDGLTVGYSELLGDAFIMSVKAPIFLMPLANLFQHEASHLYGARDHEGWDAMVTWCIMSYMWSPLTRSWCGGCKDKIESHKYHFGSDGGGGGPPKRFKAALPP